MPGCIRVSIPFVSLAEFIFQMFFFLYCLSLRLTQLGNMVQLAWFAGVVQSHLLTYAISLSLFPSYPYHYYYYLLFSIRLINVIIALFHSVCQQPVITVWFGTRKKNAKSKSHNHNSFRDLNSIFIYVHLAFRIIITVWCYINGGIHLNFEQIKSNGEWWRLNDLIKSCDAYTCLRRFKWEMIVALTSKMTKDIAHIYTLRLLCDQFNAAIQMHKTRVDRIKWQ